MAKQQDPKKKAEEIKNSFDDVTLSIKDLGKELSKVFETKKLDSFVKTLTDGFKDTVDYSDKIQDKISIVGKSVTSLSKEFGSLRGELNKFSDDISNIKSPNLKIETSVSELDMSTIQNSIKNLPEITLPAKVGDVNIDSLQNIPKNIETNIQYNVKDIELPEIKDLTATIEYNVIKPDLPKIKNISAQINYNTISPESTEVKDIQANINYQNNLPELPEVKDLNASINYNINQPDLLKDINANINYQNTLPDPPKVQDIQSNIVYQNILPKSPKADTIQGSIKYNVKDISLPKIKDIEAAVKFKEPDAIGIGASGERNPNGTNVFSLVFVDTPVVTCTRINFDRFG